MQDETLSASPHSAAGSGGGTADGAGETKSCEFFFFFFFFFFQTYFMRSTCIDNLIYIYIYCICMFLIIHVYGPVHRRIQSYTSRYMVASVASVLFDSAGEHVLSFRWSGCPQRDQLGPLDLKRSTIKTISFPRKSNNRSKKAIPGDPKPGSVWRWSTWSTNYQIFKSLSGGDQGARLLEQMRTCVLVQREDVGLAGLGCLGC